MPLSSFYPFGNFALDASDDGHSSEIPLSTIFPFFGVNQTAVYVSKSARGYIKYVATVPTVLWGEQLHNEYSSAIYLGEQQWSGIVWCTILNLYNRTISLPWCTNAESILGGC